MAKYVYQIFGLKVGVDRICPYLNLVQGVPDVVVEFREGPFSIDNPDVEGICFMLNESNYVLKIRGVADFRVSDGKFIDIDLAQRADWNTVCRYLYGPVFAALLRQKGLLLLNASAVIDKSGQCTLFSGHSGTGKSMLASYCVQSGYQFIADELSAVQLLNGIPCVIPAPACQKLWQDSCQFPELATEELVRVHPQLNKFYVNRSEQAVTSPIPITRIVFLEFHKYRNPVLKEIKGGEKIDLLTLHGYRHEAISKGTMNKNHFQLLMKVASGVRMFSIKRFESFTFPDVLLKMQGDYFRELLTASQLKR